MNKSNIVYICQGTCGAKVTEEECEKGLTKCGAKNCTYYGTPFVKMKINSKGEMYPEIAGHKH